MSDKLLNEIFGRMGLPPLELSREAPKAVPRLATAVNSIYVAPCAGTGLSTYPNPFELTLGGKTYLVKFWSGERLSGDLLALDTETTLISGAEVPKLTLLICSTGSETIIMHPDDAAAFIILHRDCELVFHNAPFDFWVLVNHFNEHGQDDAFYHMWDLAQINRLHDSMILDQLVRLGRDGVFPNTRSLDEVAREYAAVVLDKNNPYRLRFSEIIDKDWAHIDAGFFHYAAADAVATWLAYRNLKIEGQRIADTIGSRAWPDSIARYGLLTEGVQIRAGIALGSINQNGIAVDQAQLSTIHHSLGQRIETLVHDIQSLSISRGFFKQDRNGKLLLCDNGVPRIDQKRQQAVLTEIVQMHGSSDLPEILRTKEGLLKRDEESWEPYSACSPFIAKWLELESVGKLRSFTRLNMGRVHPKYTILVLTGRTSCSSPNMQQFPRNGGVRECFVPTPGYHFLIIDYSYIELVVLAAICKQRYGFSKLAEVIAMGVDPHVYTAALIMGMNLDEFKKLEQTDYKRFKELRQKAKALNFGIPGGLGVKSLRSYALNTYGVEMTEAEATEWRLKLIHGVYPELNNYLRDLSMHVLAGHLGCKYYEIWKSIGSNFLTDRWVPRVIFNVMNGKPFKRNGDHYKPAMIERVWRGLESCCRRDEVSARLKTRIGSDELGRLCLDDAVTLTGRMRARTTYTETRNSPFQGTAADGAKEALFDLVAAGYRIAAFIHDEFIIELPVDDDHAAQAKLISGIVCGAMSRVLNCSVPVRCEFALATRWSKEAKAVWRDDGKLLPWSPKNM